MRFIRMNSEDFLFRMDKTAFWTGPMSEDWTKKDRDFWLSKTPEERFAAVEILRQRMYPGYNPLTDRVLRVLETIKRERS